MPGATPILRLSRIEKSFPGVMALRSADLEIHAGEIHALVGENGAGKSTLIKIMTGAHAPDRGTPALDGNPTRFHDPLDAFRAGVAAIYQEFNLVPGLSARENLFLGRESVRAGVIDEAEERARAGPALRRLGAAFDPEDPVRNLNIAEQQLVEIARAILADTRILIMDEPTAALAPREVEILFNILSALRERGHGILFVSHRLAEVRRIADRITVMRDGATLGTWAAADMTADRMIELMVGRPLPATEKGSDRVPGSTGPEVLAVRNLSAGRVRGVSFTLNAGEVLGLAGLVGAGRTEVVRLLFGADPPREGTILMNGRAIVNRSPRDAIRHGICLLTEDRKGLGLVLGLSARDNFSLPSLRRWST